MNWDRFFVPTVLGNSFETAQMKRCEANASDPTYSTGANFQAFGEKMDALRRAYSFTRNAEDSLLVTHEEKPKMGVLDI